MASAGASGHVSWLTPENVDNGARTSIALWNDTNRTDAQVWKCFGKVVRQYQPLPLFDHVGHLSMEKGAMILSRLVGSPQ
jgi:hypothetical protein